MPFANLTETDLSIYFFGKAPSTEVCYRHSFKEFFSLPTTPERVEEVTLGHVVLYLRQHHAKQDRGATKAAALKSLFRFLTATGRLQENPLVILKIPKPRRVRHARHASKKDVYRLLSEAQKYGAEFYLPIALLYFCGLRVGECVTLRVSDVGKKHIAAEGKTNVRNVFVPLKIRRKLAAYVRGKPAGAYLFEGKDGRHITTSAIYRRVVGLATTVRITPHVLRHAHAQIALAAGADLVQVSRSLGHSSPQTTLKWYLCTTGGKPSGSFL